MLPDQLGEVDMDTDTNRCRMRRKESKILRHVLMFIFAAALVMSISPQTVFAEDAAMVVFRYVVDEMDLSPAAACGIMGNIQAESNFNAGISGSMGVGLCQWTGVRASRLHAFCASNKLDSMTAAGQVAFIHHELKTVYPHVFAYLQSVSNDANGAYSAAYQFCVSYEIPANAASMGAYRGSLARNVYWPRFGETMLFLTAAPAKNGIELKWRGKIQEEQVIMRSEEKNGTYVKIGSVGKKVRTFLDSNVRHKKKYFYYICSRSEYRKYVRKKKDAPNRSNKYEVTSARSVKDDNCVIEVADSGYVYTGKRKWPGVAVYYTGKKLKKGRDYKLSYANNLNAGKATVTITGIGSYCGATRRSFSIGKAEMSCRVSDVKAYLKDGSAEPQIRVKGLANPKYRLISTSDRSVAVIRKGKLVLKKAGRTKVALRIYGGTNYLSAVKEFTLTVRKK